ncbi:MAG: M20 family metallo-hydrolase [Bifidobacteriaceae bacterium]|jgi:N-carbamoyl-L-amino-acid hydrolase|nr:M20 family metallo-hydrolase [Bifidobacteriaceae bacterium]
MTKKTRADSFLADFAQLAQFGATGRGGIDRQAATPADIEARRWLSELLERQGLAVDCDAAGNQFGRLELAGDAPSVLVGSHLDSQPTAGRFDGAYGVLAAAYAAFEVARRVQAGELSPRLNLAVVNWFNEEGCRFQPSMMGSACYTGTYPLDALHSARDSAGVTVREALAGADCLGERPGPRAACAAEIHIEQGRGLEESGHQIGLVEATWAARKYVVEVVGEQAHSGSALMVDRRDALYGAALIILAARQLADGSAGALHAGVGQIEVYPNSPVVVPSRVRLLLDLRSPDQTVLDAAGAALEQRFAEAEAAARVEVRQTLSHAWDVNPYQAEGLALAERCAKRLALRHRRLMTVAGHDSTNLKELVPTVMLFVPSAQGVSHNEAEFTHDADLLAGLAMLTEVVSELVAGALAAD